MHLEAVRRLGSVEVISVRARTEPDYRRAMDDPKLDAVHICTPNAYHLPLVRAAMEAGKHVVCEKPLALSSGEAREMVSLAVARNLRNCTCHNLRYYPMVQHMRQMRLEGELGEILIVQGTYSQDWLLYDTDWNWRLDSRQNGPLRAMADIGSHWCDMAEHVTGQRITALCADLQTFHETRKRPKHAIETFAGKTLAPEDYEPVPIDTEDFGSVLFHMGARTRGCFTASQVSPGCKNRLRIEIYGSKAGVAWDQETPDTLWIGNRNTNNQILIKDPSLLKSGARPFADLPGGHSEGYDDTFKQVFRRFYGSIAQPGAPVEYPEFADGLRQLQILETELASHRRRAWLEVPKV